jgi:subtilase family serine protease
MKVDSFVKSAVLGALAVTGVSFPGHASAAAHVEVLGAADQSAAAHFSVFLPLTNTAALEQLLQDQTNKASPSYHKWLTPAQFKAQFGPNQTNMAQVRAMLQAAGLTVVGEHTQSFEVEGPVSAVEKMFATHLQQVKTAQGRIKLSAAEQHLTLPQEFAAMGAVIPQFTEHLTSQVHSHVAKPLAAGDLTVPLGRLSSTNSFFYPNDLNEAYQLPSFRTEVVPLTSPRPAQIAGVGAHIGIVMSSLINPADLTSTFNSTVTLGSGAKLIQAYSANSNLPVPTVTIRPVDGGSGAFDPASAGAAEASLDTQMSLGTAPGAKEVLYNIPDLNVASIIDAYTAVDEDNTVDVVSSSFGECELDFTAAYNGGTDFTSILKTEHFLFQQGNAQGITFVASSGDQGAVPCVSAAFANNPTNGTSFVQGVSSPASDSSVTSVGGTNLKTSATPTVDDATYASENANFDPRLPAQFQISATETVTVGNHTWGSGGGFSSVFARPSYQSLVNTGSTTRRSVPDVSLMMGGCPGDSDLAVQNCTLLPRSAAIIWIGGAPSMLIGTSSSAPEMAGVLALAVELNGRLGNVNPIIYELSAIQTSAGGANAPAAKQFFHRTVSGNNNGFTVKPGQAYSEVLGNGTLDVKTFLGFSTAAAPAGTPNTPSNP